MHDKQAAQRDRTTALADEHDPPEQLPAATLGGDVAAIGGPPHDDHDPGDRRRREHAEPPQVDRQLPVEQQGNGADNHQRSRDPAHLDSPHGNDPIGVQALQPHRPHARHRHDCGGEDSRPHGVGTPVRQGDDGDRETDAECDPVTADQQPVQTCTARLSCHERGAALARSVQVRVSLCQAQPP